MSFRCPHCGSEDKFLIMATMDVMVDAEEEELDSDLEQIVYWGHCNYVVCGKCSRGGDVIDFRHASGKHLISGEPLKFQPFDRVLVRNEDGDLWNPRFYEFHDIDTDSYVTIGGSKWKQCIPYKGNEGLCCRNNKIEED